MMRRFSLIARINKDGIFGKDRSRWRATWRLRKLAQRLDALAASQHL